MNITIWLVMESATDSSCPAKVAVIAGTREKAIEWIDATLRRLYSGPDWRVSGWLELPDQGRQIKASSKLHPRAVDFRVRPTQIEAPIPAPDSAHGVERPAATTRSIEQRSPTLPATPAPPAPTERILRQGLAVDLPTPPPPVVNGVDEEGLWFPHAMD